MRTRLNITSGGLIVLLTILLVTACTAQAVTEEVPPLGSNETPEPGGCNPMVANAEDGLTSLFLPDGSEVYLTDDTEIEIFLAGVCLEITETRVVIRKGQIAIKVVADEGSWLYVGNPSGALARLSDTGVVSYDPVSGWFLLDCTNGNCALGVNMQQLNQLACGEGGSLALDGSFGGPTAIDTSILRVRYGEWIVPDCLDVATVTPTRPGPEETPNQAATATAFCATYEGLFPATPCPGPQP